MLKKLFYKPRTNNCQLECGFTLVEVLLVVGALVIVFALSSPIFLAMQQSNDLNVAVDMITQSVTRAQTLSQQMQSDSAWGVKILSGSVVMFQGATYAARNANFDETYATSSALTINTGANLTDEFDFIKLTGELFTDAVTTLNCNNSSARCSSISASQINLTRCIIINKKGSISTTTSACPN